MPDRNPYLIVGVDFGSSGDEARHAFAHAARRIRREGGAWDIEDLNWALHEIEALERIERSVEKIEIVTVVREPNTGMSADAYDGLRKQVIASASERSAHLIQLAELDAAVRSGAGSADLAALAREWLGQASLVAVDDPKVDDAFELVGPDDAPGRHVLRPGYVDALTGRVVRAGLLERRD